MKVKEVLEELGALKNPEYTKKLDYYKIETTEAYGIRTPDLKKIAKKHKPDHKLAIELWQTNIHEAKLLSLFLDDPKQVDDIRIESIITSSYSWDLVDQACINIFCKLPNAFALAEEWVTREPEFERRAGFSQMAALAIHAKKAPDDAFHPFFTLIQTYAFDDRNFVKKAVNWALRGIGKRSLKLNKLAIQCALEIQNQNHSSSKWIASDALRELQSAKIISRLEKKN